MIEVTRLNDTVFIINSDLIELIEKTPDTVITLTNGKKFIVKDSVDEVVSKVIKFRQSINMGLSFYSGKKEENQ